MPHDAGEHLLGVGAVPGAIAAADLAGDDGGPNGLFGAPVGGVDRRVPQKAEYRREFGGQVRGEAVGGVQRRRFVDQPTELGEQSARERLPDHGRSAARRRGGRVGRGRLAGRVAPGRPMGCADDRFGVAALAGSGEPDRSGAARG